MIDRVFVPMDRSIGYLNKFVYEGKMEGIDIETDNDARTMTIFGGALLSNKVFLFFLLSRPYRMI